MELQTCIFFGQALIKRFSEGASEYYPQQIFVFCGNRFIDMVFFEEPFAENEFILQTDYTGPIENAWNWYLDPASHTEEE